jgi:hypothetical protein
MKLAHAAAWLSGLAACCLSIFFLAGCAPADAVVTGKVMLGDKPLPSGRITFLCDGGDKPVLSSEIRDGAYSLQGAAVGSAEVIVETFAPRPFVPVPGMPTAPSPTTGGPGGGPTVAVASTGAYVPIPEKYKRPETSGLKFEIKPGPQTIDVALTP